MCRESKREADGMGLTLLEVLLSLVITGVIAAVVLTFSSAHYRLASQVKAKSELDYALFRAGQVLTAAVSSGEKVKWTGKVLSVTSRQEGKIVVDTYYLADKDLDGIPDLYRERLGVPNPIASRLTAFTCTELKRGLWKISLRAGEKGTGVDWERIVRQRVCAEQT